MTGHPFSLPLLFCAVILLTLSACSQPPAPSPTANETSPPAIKQSTSAPATVVTEAVAERETEPPREQAPEPLPLQAEEHAEGWIRLFDGATLYGWQPAVKANWQVQDGAITVSEGEVGLLCTTTRFDDYELKLQFKAEKGTNSGIFLRTPLLLHVVVDAQEILQFLGIVQHPGRGLVFHRARRVGRGAR